MKLNFFVLLFCLLYNSIVCYDGDELDHTGCPKVFSGRCNCGPAWYKAWNSDRKMWITNCTNTGFTDPGILENIPAQTEVLIFYGNQFRRLPWNLFGMWENHTSLEVVDLTNNQIQEIQGKSFHKVHNVKRLILNHNDLYIVSTMNHPRIFSNFVNLEELHLTNAFTEQVDSKWYLADLKYIFMSSDLKKLVKLHLEQNEIWEIKDDDMFCDLPSLLDIHLGDNQLTDISFSLDCLKRLRYVDLSYNKIRNIKNETLRLVDHVFADSEKKIDLHGNPFHCDCDMNDLWNWMRKENNQTFLVNKNEMRCFDGWPEANAGKRIINVNMLDCAPARGHQYDPSSTSHYAITSTLLTVLIIITTTLLLVILWINRITVREKFTPLIENFKTSLQYSTLEGKEPIPEEAHV